MLFLACLAIVHTDARGVVGKAENSKMKINPPLTDVSSDKKFFGPPFPADYPDDRRPSVDHAALDKLRAAGEPYPKLQKASHFDTDYVKDENADNGDWKAQFAYDAQRKKVAEEEAAEKRAAEKDAQEKSEADETQKKLDEAAKKADNAAKEEEGAKKEQDSADKAVTDEESHAKNEDKAAEDKENGKEKTNQETVEEMKKKVKEAEDKLEEQKKAFAMCQKKLEDAQAEVATLKEKLKKYEDESSKSVKLWLEDEAKQTASRKKAHESMVEALKLKSHAAKDRVEAARKSKEELQQALEKERINLAKEKTENDLAQKNVLQHKASVAQAMKDLENARLRLQRFRTPPAAPVKSCTLVAAPLSIVGAMLSWALAFS